MTKLKGIAVVILALLLIVAGAFFPQTVSALLDYKNTDSVSSRAISSVQFEITENISTIGKLAMLSRMDRSIELTEGMARMSRDDVMAAVYKGLQPYIDAHLIDYSETDVQMQPSLIQVENDLQLQGVVWLVAIFCEPYDYTGINLVLDDETGHILMLYYISEEYRDFLNADDALSVFADIYFTSLGIEDYPGAIISDMEYVYADENTTAMRYCFMDARYGEINVDLFVRADGFYVEFP